MKLIAFFFLTAMLYMCTPALSQRVSISGKNLSLEQVFMEIRKQTSIEFVYESALLKTAHKVTLHVQEMPVEDILQHCLQGQGLGFNVRSNTIIIFKLDDDTQTKDPVNDARVVHITGRVVDAQGQPVEMASVILMRTNAGTQTDRFGLFVLKIKELQATDSVNISFVGLKSHSLQPGNKRDLGNIVLQLADNVLDETVIRAYGATSERFRTGDIAMVKSADIEKIPALNIVEALAGRIPGLNVWQSGSFASSVYNIQLRGTNIIPPDAVAVSRASSMVYLLSKPLMVVDGLPMAPDLVHASGNNYGMDASTGLIGAGGGHDPLYWLNPLDIESISVLKNAEATALYGSRAANGVIIITTKKGKPGKTALNITVNTGINVQAKRLKLMNTQQYLAMRHEAWDNTIKTGLPVAGLHSFDLLQWDTTRYTDWQQVLLGSAPNSNAHLELSGGKGPTAYRLGAGYNNARASYPTPPGTAAFREERSTLSLHISTRSHNNRFKLVTVASGAAFYSFQPFYDAYNYIFLAPNAPAMLDENGQINNKQWQTGATGTSLLTGNPMQLMRYTYQANWSSMQVSSHLSYELIRSLVFSINAGYIGSNGRQLRKTPPISSDSTLLSSVRSSSFGHSTDNGFTVEPSLRYENSMERNHFILQAGGSFQSDKQEGHVTTGRGFTTDDQMGSLTGAKTLSYLNNIAVRKTLSGWGRASYLYAGKYLADLSVRRDGSSSFGPGRRYGNFGSMGLGWIFTDEPWGRHLPLLTFGKIRGSYGITGCQNYLPYAYFATYTRPGTVGFPLPNFLYGIFTNGIYDGVSSLTLTRTANPNLGWAQANSADLGIDLYFLTDQRLKLTFQWYREIIGNQFVITPVSGVVGNQNTFIDNTAAKVENSGIEALIDYRSSVHPTGINWNIHFNIAANRNKLLAYPGLESLYLDYYYDIGQPLIRQELWSSFLNTKLGLYQYVDPAHPAAVSHFANNNPAFTGGLQAGISWKGVSLSINCVYAKQQGFINMQGTGLPGNLDPTGIGNQPLSVIQHKQPGGAFYAGPISNNLTMDINWGDASYMAIKNASLNYRFPESLLHKWGMSIYLNAENLLVLSTAYQGTNPEQAGLTDTQLPLRRILVTGFTINL
ncbi:SusC/RagA family TonB-linked outer membrane protein [Niastella yeongjuensis]|nr:SusC/RagA family TonB-linked outer membrane protein [Niastella yeongjuensis]